MFRPEFCPYWEKYEAFNRFTISGQNRLPRSTILIAGSPIYHFVVLSLGRPIRRERVLPSRVPPEQVIRFSVKPLSLHRRLHTTALPQEYSRRRMNSLALSGTFTAQAIHDWLAACLPEVPHRLVPVMCNSLYLE